MPKRSEESNPVHYQLDFPKIFDIARLGVMRASIFMGLGINAALDPNNRKYELGDIAQFQMLPHNVDDNLIQNFKDEFAIWIVANGLRELIETFALFLDELYCACALVKAHKNMNEMNKLTKVQTKFARSGFPDKLDALKAAFSVEPKYPEYIKTINQVRNCLTHRRGVVTQKDCNSGNSLRVAWLGADIFLKTPKGERFSAQESKGRIFPDGADVEIQMDVKREKSFGLRSLVKFSAGELAEICWFISRESGVICTNALEYTRRSGVYIREEATPL